MAAAIDANQVQTLLVLSCNPVYSAPAGLNFASKFQKVPLRIKLGLYEDETAALCHWTIPEAHFLESWSDARQGDGTATIIQPLIAPLYEGKTAHEVIAAFGNQPAQTDREIVEAYWRNWNKDHPSQAPFDEFFRKSVHDGSVENSKSEPKRLAVRKEALATNQQQSNEPKPGEIELLLRPDPNLFDGRFANNGWLQELPKPLTKIVWDNAAIMSPNTAKSLGIEPMRPGPHGGEHGEAVTDLVELKFGKRSVTVPAFILPGVADGSVLLHFGFGRTRAGRVGTGVGVNANLLREDESFEFGGGLQVRRTGQKYTLGCTQMHHLMENRDLVRAVTVAQFKADPSCAPHHHGQPKKDTGHNPSVEGVPAELYTNPQTSGQQWGMVINLGVCNGCNACVAACQAENNIPVVGKEMVNRGREMHWLRIDRYFGGDESNPEIYHQPVPCMHCENAPCEVVCPVEATTHSPDGLNEMTYNRCVGTRYCANNCPYKVRRFNFLQYTTYAESMKLLANPQVSVRSRGVMEKCTYCVQRIRNAEITAKNQHREIADGDVVTACQAACPTEAITFGNINDPKSKVHQLKALPRNYGLLSDLNTKPRTTYLAAIRNPNRESGKAH